MSNLIRSERFVKDLFDTRRTFDRMFDRMLWPFDEEPAGFVRNAPFKFAPAVESYLDKEGKRYFCRLTLPGVEPKEVQIHAQGNLLTIAGERKATHKAKDVDFFQEEFTYGSFERTLTLPEGVQADKLVAGFHDGMLEITAPVAPAALPRKVEIKTVPAIKQPIAA